ncbi:MAG: lysophospholipid acyltransferase family protein [Candidatus Omnitrophota bacterium]
MNHAWVYRISLTVAQVLPLCVMRFITRIIAIAWHALDTSTRQQVMGNLSRVIGNDPALLHKTSRELFINYGTYLADWAKFITLDSSGVFSFFENIQGFDIFGEVCGKGKGVIILSAHLGNWELGGLVFTHSGVPFNIITAKDTVERIAQVRTRVRALHNIKTITIDEDPFFFIDIVNALKRNEVVAMLVDRYEKHNGVLVNFLGGTAYFPRGPVLLAKATGASICPAFTVLGPRNKYLSALGAPIPMEWGDDTEKDIYRNVSRIASVFEGYIRLYPNQWFNFSAL